ncbi:MAG TPA: acyl-CoA dehydrogenase family protein [Mycobacteriales bacterium]|nr:acyl-CoA dehydrogenase family protein [Mycobacteriales bacterium]
MDFDDTPDEAAWREEVRGYIAAHRDQLMTISGGGRRDVDVESAKRHQAVMYEGGLVGATWPKEYGGRGATQMQQAIVNQEIAKAGLAGFIGVIGLGMCGPTVIAHGSDDQKGRYLGRLLRGDDVWCQLFSEPASGSDLAALRTKAVKTDSGSWRVNGQKVWTTLAHVADYGILLARTDPDVAKHRGLTMFVVDMHAPGVTVRPLRQMSGVSEFNEVFFDDVEIPDEERLGEVGDGWRVALTTLMSERLSLGGGGTDVGASLDAAATHVAKRIGSLDEGRQAMVRQEFGRLYAASLATRYTGYRQLSAISKGAMPGPEASAGKLAGTKTGRALADLGVRLLGDEGVYATTSEGDGRWQSSQAGLPGMAIAGGTDEILRNVLGERVLGLPPEPRADKGVSFNDSLKLGGTTANAGGAQ